MTVPEAPWLDTRTTTNTTTASGSDGNQWQLPTDHETEALAPEPAGSYLSGSYLARGPSLIEMRNTGLEHIKALGKEHRGSSTLMESRKSFMKGDTSSSLRARSNMPFFRERRLNQIDGEGHLSKKWRAQREEAWAELEIKFKPFFKTFFYEIFPTLIAALLCTAIDGVQHARDRLFWPPKPFRIVFIDFPAVFVMIGLWYWMPPGLGSLDAITVFLLWTARATTIALKYSFYGNRDLEGEYGIGSEAYEKDHRRDRILLANMVFNLGGLQGIGLLEQLYASTLLQDVELSRLQFRVGPDCAKRIWGEVLEMLQDIYAKSDISIIKKNDGDSQGDLLNVEAPSTPASHVDEMSRKKLEHAIETDGFKGLSLARTVTAGRESDRHIGSKYELEHRMYDIGDGFLDLLLGECEESIQQGAEEGHISAAVVAVHCVVKSHHIDGKIRMLLFFSPLVVTMLFGLIPVVVNAAMGSPLFTETSEGIAVFVCQFVAMNFLFFNIFYFTWAPLKFSWNQRRVDAYLYGMLAGDLAVRAIWPPVGPQHAPRIDCEDPMNVAAWAGVQRVARGSHFAPVFQKKFNFYRVVTFGVLLLDSTVHSRIGSMWPELDTGGSKMAATVRLLTLTSAVVLELLLGMLVNNFADRHVAYLGKLRTSNAAMAAQAVENGHQEDLLASEHLLDTCMQEIEKDKLAQPVTVAFFAAEIARVSLLLTVVGLVIYQDIQSMATKFGFSTNGV